VFIIQKDRFLRVFVIYAFWGEKEVSERESIIISKSELENELKEKIEKINEILISVKNIIKHIKELIGIIDVEGFKADIDVKMHIAILEEAIINTSQVAAEFIKQLIHSKIKIYADEVMLFTDLRRLCYYVKK